MKKDTKNKNKNKNNKKMKTENVKVTSEEIGEKTPVEGRGVLNLLKIVAEIFLVVVFIFFEELVWKKFALPIKNWLTTLSVLKETQVWIEAQSTYVTLSIFLVPLGIAEVMGLYSGALIISGSLIWGVVIYALKIPVAGLTFWVFSFSKVKLLSINWFNYAYELMVKGFDWIKSTVIYKKVQATILSIKEYIKSLKGEGVFKNEIGKVYIGLKKIFQEMK